MRLLAYSEPVWDLTSTTERILQLRHVVRREAVRLVVLSTIAAAAFLGTRALAARAEHLAVVDAARWYDRGLEHLAASNGDAAAVAFRRATMKHRGEKRYVLALAEALGRSGNRDPAARALLGLRELSPEDADVNLALARLARARGDTSEAVRYYQHAIYAPAATPGNTRHLRVELVRFLLENGQDERAVAELIAASVDLPADPAPRLELAALFLRAGNPSRAAEQYQLVLTQDRANLPALEGAVRAAFELGDYRAVAAFRLPAMVSPETADRASVARDVLARDPLATRLTAAERRRRLLLNISYVEERWTACQVNAGAPAAHPQSLIDVRAAARRGTMGRDTEALEAAMTILEGLRQELAQTCGPAPPADRALAIIARTHGVGAA